MYLLSCWKSENLRICDLRNLFGLYIEKEVRKNRPSLLKEHSIVANQLSLLIFFSTYFNQWYFQYKKLLQ
jgi:hypothetical protein